MGGAGPDAAREASALSPCCLAGLPRNLFHTGKNGVVTHAASTLRRPFAILAQIC